GAGSEVVEDVLLVGTVAALAPRLAILAAAAQVRHHEDAALLEPRHVLDAEARHLADAETAVAVQERRVLAVEYAALRPHDIEGHLGPVLRHGELALDLDVVEVHRRGAE